MQGFNHTRQQKVPSRSPSGRSLASLQKVGGLVCRRGATDDIGRVAGIHCDAGRQSITQPVRAALCWCFGGGAWQWHKRDGQRHERAMNEVSSNGHYGDTPKKESQLYAHTCSVYLSLSFVIRSIFAQCEALVGLLAQVRQATLTG